MKSQSSQNTVSQSHAAGGRDTVVTSAKIKPANLAPVARGQTVELAALLNGQDRLYIAHDGRRYCLRITAQNKLILTA